MAKRFTDTEKWKKKWYRKLIPAHKVFWEYLRDNCDKSGIWEVDYELAEIFIGADLNVEEVKKEFRKQYIEIDGGKRWFIIDFIEFQYGTLNPNNPAHKNVYKELLERGLINSDGTIKELQSPIEAPLQGAKAKVKDKEEAMEEVKEEEEEIIIPDEEIEGVKYFLGELNAVVGPTEELASNWMQWVNYHHCRGTPLNQITARKQLQYLRTADNPVELIETAITNNWSGLRYDNKNGGSNKTRRNIPGDLEKGRVSKERIEQSIKKFYTEGKEP